MASYLCLIGKSQMYFSRLVLGPTFNQSRQKDVYLKSLDILLFWTTSVLSSGLNDIPDGRQYLESKKNTSGGTELMRLKKIPSNTG